MTSQNTDLSSCDILYNIKKKITLLNMTLPK
jgi:hypothetical protein